MDSKLITKLILIVVVCAAAFFGYRYFFGQSGDIDTGIAVSSVTGQSLAGLTVSDAESRQFLNLLASVRNVGTQIREEFVRDRLYNILKDYTVPVAPRPISRANPFLPIGQGGAYVYDAGDFSAPETATTTIVVATTTATTTKAKK